MAIATIAKEICHDCQKEIKDGVMLRYENNGEKISVSKCQDCFKKSPELRNFQPCEVYSRIVGYLRPVGQWNLGKQKEFGERKEYKLSKECC